jgi:hypothetical protein
MMNPPAPDGYPWSLPLLYLVAAIVVALLYLPCPLGGSPEGTAAGRVAAVRLADV